MNLIGNPDIRPDRGVRALCAVRAGDRPTGASLPRVVAVGLPAGRLGRRRRGHLGQRARDPAQPALLARSRYEHLGRYRDGREWPLRPPSGDGDPPAPDRAVVESDRDRVLPEPDDPAGVRVPSRPPPVQAVRAAPPLVEPGERDAGDRQPRRATPHDDHAAVAARVGDADDQRRRRGDVPRCQREYRLCLCRGRPSQTDHEQWENCELRVHASIVRGGREARTRNIPGLPATATGSPDGGALRRDVRSRPAVLGQW